MNYEEKDFGEIQSILNKGIALIVTATDLETDEIHKSLKPIDGYNAILKIFEGSETYYIGVFGKYLVAHVQSNMGSIGRDSAIRTISEAVNILKPKFVIMMGIAFGVDSEKQNIGDVLISEGIIPYNVKRVGSDTVLRGQNAPSSKILLSRFKSLRTWEFILENDRLAKKIFTQILSGEELIDNISRRGELTSSYPYAKGGEMEGAGLFAACDGSVDWILVKGICDFADGHKSENKKAYQTIAINSAISLCLELFNSKHAFKDLGLQPNYTNPEPLTVNYGESNKVLFEVYNQTFESYYVKRQEDENFNSFLGQYCIWIYGTSGCGKTNLILRNLLHAERSHLTISLASCFNTDVIELFQEILFDLEQCFGSIENKLPNDSFANISRNILAILRKNCANKDYIIFIEEIPVSGTKKYQDFVDHFFSLLISKKLLYELDKVKFVLSSIENPTSFIKKEQIKIHQQVKFVELNNWVESDASRLVKKISETLKIEIPEYTQKKILHISNGSPRFIKKFFRNLLAIDQYTEVDFETAMNETERELKQFMA